ncbi:MAG: hypothetical protein H6557_25945 [Lewinellaceae bacterium]|nr:hypothetical protein [Phaeodactylibacter sp.]MCB9040079.1 hypothetical protein [Lewinellaceae bacterium]
MNKIVSNKGDELNAQFKDTIENTVAICSNCHREFHHGINKEKIKDRIFREIQRIVEE